MSTGARGTRAVLEAVVLLLSAAGCGLQGSAQAEPEKPVVTINNLRLTEADLEAEPAIASALAAPTGPAEGEPEWLTQVIDRELLVQEAQKAGLDREPSFMRTIERFWKEALIKLLVERKAKEIIGQVHIYEPDIEARYLEMKAQAPAGTLEPAPSLRDTIERTLRQEKESRLMEEWLSQLRRDARIEIDREALERLS